MWEALTELLNFKKAVILAESAKELVVNNNYIPTRIFVFSFQVYSLKILKISWLGVFRLTITNVLSVTVCTGYVCKESLGAGYSVESAHRFFTFRFCCPL